jgi:hypothetical protein
MIIFTNPGRIDLLAVTTLGVSVKQAGSFGRFGTGLKFSIATILRGGGSITLHVGEDKVHLFDTRIENIQGQDFDLVTLDGEPLGFTTMLGRDWEPWMVLRELACNARDEGGDFYKEVPGESDWPGPDGEETTFLVDWPELDKAYETRGELFAEGEVIGVTDRIRALAGPGPFMYYRGVRVRKLEKPAAFRWDLLAETVLTEDRVMTSSWNADQYIMEMAVKSDNADLVAGILLAGNQTHEGHLNFDRVSHIDPSRLFIDTILDARARKDPNLSASAHAYIMNSLRKSSDETVTRVHSRQVNDPFSRAIDMLEEMNVEFTSKSVVLVEELGTEGVAYSVADERIYITRALLREPVRVIAKTLLMAHTEAEFWGITEVTEFLGRALFASNKLSWDPPMKDSGWARDEAMEAEEVAVLGGAPVLDIEPPAAPADYGDNPCSEVLS